jgi:hypothetical protein
MSAFSAVKANLARHIGSRQGHGNVLDRHQRRGCARQSKDRVLPVVEVLEPSELPVEDNVTLSLTLFEG